MVSSSHRGIKMMGISRSPSPIMDEPEGTVSEVLGSECFYLQLRSAQVHPTTPDGE